MPKYIDKDKLINSLKEDYATLVKERWFDDYVQGYSSAIDDVIAEPEITEGIFRGHWIGQPISGYADCKCSVCGAICNVHVSAGIPTQRYCYRCGAKMLEDEKNTDKNE